MSKQFTIYLLLREYVIIVLGNTPKKEESERNEIKNNNENIKESKITNCGKKKVWKVIIRNWIYLLFLNRLAK